MRAGSGSTRTQRRCEGTGAVAVVTRVAVIGDSVAEMQGWCATCRQWVVVAVIGGVLRVAWHDLTGDSVMRVERHEGTV